MNISQLIQLLLLRRNIHKHNKWTRSELEKYQTEALRRLRHYAYERSPFYKEFHKGLTDKPLNELPILTKTKLMENWNTLVTDKSVKIEEVKEFLDSLKEEDVGKLFKNKYYTVSTAGSTGLKGILVYNKKEWLIMSASYARANDWAGVKAGLTKRPRIAVVSSMAPWHQSALVGATLKNWLLPTIRIDANAKIEDIIAKLNDFQPESLVAFAGMANLLAQEQIAGNLNIFPEAVFCAAEVLTNETRELIKKAWNIQPFNVYASTETGVIASECEDHQGMHIYEDLIIIEVVDENNNPVKSGEYGKKMLATVLFSRTLPLIRYEISDSVKLSSDKCTCACPFSLLDNVQGRAEDIIYLSGQNGNTVIIQPVFFHLIMESSSVGGWQIIQKEDNVIRVLIKNPEADFSENRLIDTINEELEKMGVKKPLIELEYVEFFDKSSLGKTILIKALK
ncbi:phenylacetate--CoA ligase family protein [Methanobacterium sp. ACI-7]|uniref:phenylacetate--CoA ligase family protein n=1 Tax=unclassified Methanobacterium TaxID=2627676 RepID=UPI0039C0349E